MQYANTTNPYRVGDELVFVPDDRTRGWYQNAFDRWGVYPGYIGVVTRITESDVELENNAEAAMHWSQFRYARQVPVAEREAMAAEHRRRAK